MSNVRSCFSCSLKNPSACKDCKNTSVQSLISDLRYSEGRVSELLSQVRYLRDTLSSILSSGTLGFVAGSSQCAVTSDSRHHMPASTDFPAIGSKFSTDTCEEKPSHSDECSGV